MKDIALAARQGAAVQADRMGAARTDDGSVALAVEPMLVPRENQLAGVEDVFNAVLVKGDMLGDVVFYGKGAGKLPTASAVVADVIDALKNGVKIHDSLFWQDIRAASRAFTATARRRTITSGWKTRPRRWQRTCSASRSKCWIPRTARPCLRCAA